MQIQHVTFSGPDETVDPNELIDLTNEFPTLKIEWGLLLSRSVGQVGFARYPGRLWLNKLVDQCGTSLNLSGHIQGEWLRYLVEHGILGLVIECSHLWDCLQRLQLNFHGQKQVHVDSTFYGVVGEISKTHQVIFQAEGVNESLFYKAKEQGFNVVPLFDMSHGGGRVPSNWPGPFGSYLHGYAGGLGPYNLEQELDRISQVVGETPVWIDMETNIRSDCGKKFDLNKCRQVLRILQKRVS